MKNKLGRFLLVTAIEGLIVFVVLITNHYKPYYFEITSDSKLLLSYILIGGSLIALILSTAGFLLLSKRPLLQERILSFFHEPIKFLLTLLFSLIVLIECIQDISFGLAGFTKPHVLFVYYQAYLVQLFPVLLWVLIFSIRFLSLVIRENPDLELSPKKFIQQNSRYVIVFSILLLLWIILAFTPFGYIAHTTDNYERRRLFGRFLPLTNPILGYQVSFVVFLLSGIYFLITHIQGSAQRIVTILKKPIILFLLVWLIAFLAWSAVPLEPNYLVDLPEYPVDTIYPNSDAFYFAKEAQGFLLTGEFDQKTTHVVYSLFLAGLSQVSGNDYQRMIRLQLLIVSLAPALLFIFSSRLHNKFSGLLVSILFIIRERNGMLLGTELAGPVNNVLLSENLAIIGLILFLYLIYLWLEDPGKGSLLPAIAGGVMGVSLLIRADYAAVLLAGLFFSLILLWNQRKVWLKGMISILLVTGVIIGPWMFRNWQKTGVVYLDKQNVMLNRIISYYDQITSGNQEEGISDIQSENQTGLVRESSSIWHHAGNNLHQSFLYLPNAYLPLSGLGSYFFGQSAWKNLDRLSILKFEEGALNIYTRALPYYWVEWQGKAHPASVVPMLITLSAIAGGVVLLSREKSRPDLLLILSLISHILIWAIPGLSGNRFMKSIDWITLIFFGIGVTVTIQKGIEWLKKQGSIPAPFLDALRNSNADHQSFRLGQSWIGVATIGILVLVGLSPTVLERVMPSEYSQQELDDLIAGRLDWINVNGENEDQCLSEYGSYSDKEYYFGGALFPRYYSTEETLGNDRRNIPFDPGEERIGFYLAGTANKGVILLKAGPEMLFSHFQDVIVVGKLKSDHYIEADCLYLVDSGDEDGIMHKVYDSFAVQ